MPINSIGNLGSTGAPAAVSTGSAPASGASAGANNATNGAGGSGLGGTFLTLLTQELQNQDPTAPMDSTQMVGQMISLNQLDQLTGIHQILSNQFPSASSSVPAAPSPS